MQPVVLKALAKLVYDFKFSRKLSEKSESYYYILLEGISNLDFSHSNKIWQYYEMSESERKIYFLVPIVIYQMKKVVTVI